MQRDWPATDKPAASGDPWNVFTTETVTYTAVASPLPTGYELYYTSYVASYGPGYGSAIWNNYSLTVESVPRPGALVSTMTADVAYAGNLTEVSISGTSTLDREGLVVSTGITVGDPSDPLRQVSSSIDPLPGGGGWRAKLRRAVGWTTRRAMTAVAGAGCAIATAAVAGSAGIFSIGSLGAATPAGIGATALTGGACAVITTGTYELLAPLDQA